MAYTIGENDCGCKILATQDETAKTPYWIDYCTKHKAVLELYEACKKALESRNMKISWTTLKKLQQALIEADGKP